MHGPISQFVQQERILIIKQFGVLRSSTLVRRAFRVEFKIKPRDLPHQKQLSRVLHKFEACGDVGDPQVKRRPSDSDSVPQHDVKAVEDFFLRNEEGHIRDAAKEFSLSFGKIWFILRKILKWKAYRTHTTRLNAAQWYLSHELHFFSKQVIWSDEKYFVLKQGPK